MPSPMTASFFHITKLVKEKLANGPSPAILAVADDKVIASSGLVVHEHPPVHQIPKRPRGAHCTRNMYTTPRMGSARDIATRIVATIFVSRKVAREKARKAIESLPRPTD